MSLRNTGGLTQRKSAAVTHLQRESDEDERKYEEDDLDHDSKETRLTLMEEVLLLGLKDREVCAPPRTDM